MEDKKYYKDELKKLGIEDLESVAGGYTMEQMTEEEIKRSHERDAKRKKARTDCNAGKIPVSEYEAIANEYHDFIKMLLKKYDGIDN